MAVAAAGAEINDPKLSYSNLHDVSLALSMGKTVVGNDLNAGRKDIIIITGANTGGKSTFLRSVGLAHVMMQAGMFVSVQSFAAEVCDGNALQVRRRRQYGKREIG